MAYPLTLEEGWSYIETEIKKLQNILEGYPEQAIDSAQHSNLYSTIFYLCGQRYPPGDHSREIYNRYRKAIEDYTKEKVLPSLINKHDEHLLGDFVKRWDNHKTMVRWLSHFFSYLDRFFVPDNQLPSLKDVGLTCFFNLVYKEMQCETKEAILALIHKEREGEQIDRPLLKNVIDVFVENGMGEIDRYEEDFERSFLQCTTSYYSRKASRWIQEDSLPAYMQKSEECLRKERERVTHYLHSSTEVKLIEKVQNELFVALVAFAKQLLENEHSGYRALLRDNKMDDLSRMYRLYHKIPHGLQPFAELFKQHVTAEGSILFKQAEDATTDQVFIRKVIELHDKCMVYVTECFENHNLFHKALKHAFQIFCNNALSRSSSEEYLAAFCDNILQKRGSEELSDEAIEATFKNVVKLLTYLSNRDLFSEFYREKQARRLLCDRSANEDHERSMLTWLREEFGGDFTSKMEGMMTDMILAREIQTSFETYQNTNTNSQPGIDLSVTVLNAEFWPTYKTSDLNLPSEIVKCVEAFKGFYEKENIHRRTLSWIYSLGTCHVSGKFDQETIELIVSTYQAAVLMLFNNTERLTYIEIFEELKLSHEDLVRLLFSLSCANYKILKKEPMSKSISESDVFEFNSAFTDKMRRSEIRLPLLPPVDERKKTVENVQKDRRYAVEATLVRIMKSRQVLGHQQLVSECVEQLSQKFKPDIKLIKDRIENLITRDYLERDAEDPNNLKYLT